MTDIIIITNDQFSYAKDVIGYIKERTKTPYQFLVVDNGSRDGTREWLLDQQKEFPGLFKKVICFETKINEDDAKNTALEFVENELFVIVNNSLCPSLQPDWLSKMANLVRRYRGFAAIAMRPQIIKGIPPIFQANHEVVECKRVQDTFKFIWTGLARTVGGWGVNFDGRLKELGYKVGYAKDFFCYKFTENDYDKEDIDLVTMIPKVRHNE